ncbi:hypothetical protein C1J03_19280 [Sulfitobacter sp. SK012]|uniref:STAS/SEC14 domain-containing protein n=1 Tax=Sulfitobacter sp. SK012 TaxID=1389005 RepID=UPI000E0AE3E7|nr:STAS/SEC14 domain-containing protein [Sulfitobacter sp. SK012]AXI48990.1 hypothetical protein C1J03_19280 [Sulfitobacter sp. SK012]
MLNVTKVSADRINIELSGAIDADEMSTVLDHLLRKSEGVSNGKMLYTISDFAMPTLSALVVELYRMPELLGLLGKFKKCAVLCDTAWVRTAAEFEGAVFRSLDIKSFTLSDTEAAETWLNGRQESAEQEEEEENFPV